MALVILIYPVSQLRPISSLGHHRAPAVLKKTAFLFKSSHWLVVKLTIRSAYY